MREQGDNKNHRKNEKEDLGNSRGRESHAAKSQKSGDQRNAYRLRTTAAN
jgi:hypothetical protein